MMNSSKQFKDMCIFTETKITEFIKRISSLTNIKSRTGIEYIVLSVSKERIHIKRLSTENTADLDTHALYRAYITENSNTLKTLKNTTIKKNTVFLWLNRQLGPYSMQCTETSKINRPTEHINCFNR